MSMVVCMDPDFIDFDGGYVWFGQTAVPITSAFDCYGDECEPEDACSIVFGPLPGDGLYVAQALEHLEVTEH